MRARFLAAGLLTLGWGAGLFAQAGSKAAVEKTLIANENKINDAVTKHDVKTFNDLVASDALSADGSGFMKNPQSCGYSEEMRLFAFSSPPDVATPQPPQLGNRRRNEIPDRFKWNLADIFPDWQA